MSVLREKEVFKNILELYRDLPCLWNQSHELYNNKIARKEGLNQLVEMYRLIEPDAQLHDIKKKIENFRTTYRRERVKVLKSRMNDGPEYVPTLWYYKHLRFLDETFHGASMPQSPKSSEYVEEGKLDTEEEEEENYMFKTESNSDSPPPPKKKKLSSNLILLTEDGHDLDQEPYTISLNDHSKNNLEQTSSTESFGRTVGLQLSELPPMQRFIAEKLISDVIFYGRLEKLNPKTTLNMNNHNFN